MRIHWIRHAACCQRGQVLAAVRVPGRGQRLRAGRVQPLFVIAFPCQLLPGDKPPPGQRVEAVLGQPLPGVLRHAATANSTHGRRPAGRLSSSWTGLLRNGVNEVNGARINGMKEGGMERKRNLTVSVRA